MARAIVRAGLGAPLRVALLGGCWVAAPGSGAHPAACQLTARPTPQPLAAPGPTRRARPGSDWLEAPKWTHRWMLSYLTAVCVKREREQRQYHTFAAGNLGRAGGSIGHGGKSARVRPTHQGVGVDSLPVPAGGRMGALGRSFAHEKQRDYSNLSDASGIDFPPCLASVVPAAHRRPPKSTRQRGRTRHVRGAQSCGRRPCKRTGLSRPRCLHIFDARTVYKLPCIL